MAAFVLTLIGAVFIAGAAWLGLGSRFRLVDDDERNDRLNFAAYYLGALPVAFVVVFFGLG